MKIKKIYNKFIIRLDKGEEIVASLKKICQDYKINLGSISGIGATNKATIGLFDVESKKYHPKELIGNYEIASLYGNVTTMNKEVYLHLHINLCDSNYNSFGGHLNSAVVSATFEGIIEIIDGQIEREYNNETGLNLLKI